MVVAAMVEAGRLEASLVLLLLGVVV